MTRFQNNCSIKFNCLFLSLSLSLSLSLFLSLSVCMCVCVWVCVCMCVLLIFPTVCLFCSFHTEWSQNIFFLLPKVICYRQRLCVHFLWRRLCFPFPYVNYPGHRTYRQKDIFFYCFSHVYRSFLLFDLNNIGWSYGRKKLIEIYLIYNLSQS